MGFRLVCFEVQWGFVVINLIKVGGQSTLSIKRHVANDKEHDTSTSTTRSRLYSFSLYSDQFLRR